MDLPAELLIYICDDNSDILIGLGEESAFSNKNFRMFNSQHDLLNALDKHTPDIIILELVLLKGSGIDIIRNIKKSPEHSQIPIIFLSSVNDGYLVAEIFKLGAADFIRKPVSSIELAARIKRSILEAKERKLLLTKKLELERFNDSMVNRELKIIELKQEVNRLKEQLGQPTIYQIPV